MSEIERIEILERRLAVIIDILQSEGAIRTDVLGAIAVEESFASHGDVADHIVGPDNVS